jgi:NTP pyrophosphatase (non-canonical NTP hydrolase)
MSALDRDIVGIVKPTGDTQLLQYREFVATLIKKFEDWRLEHAHAAMGVTGEAGELSDAIKKHAIYGKEPDIKNIIEELGDLEFFMQDIRTKYGISRSITLQANADKLCERYVGLVYTDEAAIARADKVEGEPSIQLENEIADMPVEECWVRTDVAHIFINTKSGEFAHSTEDEQLVTGFKSAVDATTALTKYTPYDPKDYYQRLGDGSSV